MTASNQIVSPFDWRNYPAQLSRMMASSDSTHLNAGGVRNVSMAATKRGPGARLTPAQKTGIADLTNQGKTIQEIVDILGVGRASVHRTRRRLNLTKDYSVDEAAIRKRVLAGWTVKQITDDLGISDESVRRVRHTIDTDILDDIVPRPMVERVRTAIRAIDGTMTRYEIAATLKQKPSSIISLLEFLVCRGYADHGAYRDGSHTYYVTDLGIQKLEELDAQASSPDC